MTAAEILSEVCREHGVTRQELWARTRRPEIERIRVEAIRRLYETGRTASAIGRAMHRDHTTIGHHLRRLGFPPQSTAGCRAWKGDSPARGLPIMMNLTPSQTKVLEAVKRFCRKGMIVPRNDELARLSCCSYSNVVESLKKLQGAGLLVIELDDDPRTASLCHRRITDPATGGRSEWSICRDQRMSWTEAPDAELMATDVGRARMEALDFSGENVELRPSVGKAPGRPATNVATEGWAL